MTKEVKSHQFWLNNIGQVVKQEGNLLDSDKLDELVQKLVCPILVSVFDIVLEMTPDSPALYIPAVNLSTEWINGFFDYFLSKTDEDLILWEIKDMTEINNNKLVRVQPEMERKLKEEILIFQNSGASCEKIDPNV